MTEELKRKVAMKSAVKKEKKSSEKYEKRHEYDKRKKKIAELEQNNHRYVFVFRSDENWWKIGWNSLLFYRYLIAPRVGLEPKVHNDGDFGAKSKTGIISVRDTPGWLEKFEQDFKACGAELLRTKSTANVKVFSLGYNVKDEDIRRFKKAEEEKIRRLNEILKVEVSMPDLYTRLYEAAGTIHRVTKHASQPDREACLYQVEKWALTAMKDYQLMAWGIITPERGLRLIMTDIIEATARLNVAGRLDIIDKDKALTIGSYLADARKLVLAQMGVKADSAAEAMGWKK